MNQIAGKHTSNVGLRCLTGLLTLLSGSPSDAWIFIFHGIAGGLLAIVVAIKLHRVWSRIRSFHRWDRRTIISLFAMLLVATALLSGWIWSDGGDRNIAGWNLLNWHIVLGLTLTLAVVLHAFLRAKPLRTRDIRNRRQFFLFAGSAMVTGIAWWLQRPTAAALRWRGAQRRWTGSYEQASFRGNAFPTSS